MAARLVLAALVAVIGTAGIAAAAQVRDAQHSPRGSGQFYADCGFSHRLTDDSIVFPGQPGRSHLHDFFGNRTTNAHSTVASLQKGKTNCHRVQDKAAYWAPTLYAGADNDPIKVVNAQAFYLSGFRDFESIQPFPSGLEMIAGDAKATEQQPGRNVDWRCTGDELDPGASSASSPRAQELRAVIAFFDKAVESRQAKMLKRRKAVRSNRRALRRARAHGRKQLVKRRRAKLVRAKRAYKRSRKAYLDAKAERDNRSAALEAYLIGGGTSIPTCTPGSQLTLRVQFPDCWDGVNLDSADHKSHMAYSSRPRKSDTHICPRSHPVLVPILLLRVTYASDGGPDVRLSPGDVDAGHADFVNAWDQEALAKLVRNCLNVDMYCGGGATPHHTQPGTSPTPDPGSDPLPSPAPEPQPEPEPEPEPEPDDPILPLPLP